MLIIMSNLSFILFSVGGTVGATITCPLEVVKTRLQASFLMIKRSTQNSRACFSSRVVCLHMYWYSSTKLPNFQLELRL